MNILHLRYAAEVERTGSITQAAENLYMAQPNLSKAMKELEKSVGFSIFKRTARGMVPTVKGAEFLAQVKPLLQQIEALEIRYQPESAAGTRFQISVPRDCYITQAFANFLHGLDFLQGMEISFRETNLTQALSDVAEGNSSLAIIRYPEESEAQIRSLLTERDLDWEPLFLFETKVLLSEQHPLAERETIREQELEPFMELVFGDEQLPVGLRKGMSGSTSVGKKRIQIYDRGSQLTVLGELPMSYMWSAPVPEHLLCRHGLVQKSCGGDRSKEKDVFVYPKGHPLSPLEKAFREELFRVRNTMKSSLAYEQGY